MRSAGFFVHKKVLIDILVLISVGPNYVLEIDFVSR